VTPQVSWADITSAGNFLAWGARRIMKRYVYAFFAVLTFVSAQAYQGNAQSFSPKPETRRQQ